MKVYAIFETDDYCSRRVCTCATKELAEDYCMFMNSVEKLEFSKWWYSEEDVIVKPFWTRKDEE